MPYICLIFLIFKCPLSLWAQENIKPTTPSLSIVPFYALSDPDYGIFMADRLTAELSQYAYFLPQRRQRFQLIEAGQLDTTTIKKIAQEASHLPQEVQQTITMPTDYLISGWVETTGIHQLHVSLTDLKTHNIIWKATQRDNLANFWMGDTNQGLGDALVSELCQALGYGSQETASPWTKKLPKKILWHPLSCQAYPSLASNINRAINQTLTNDTPFQIIYNEDSEKKEKVLNTHPRQKAFSIEADAILRGSILALGKDNKVSAIGVALRLIDISSGEILWTTVRNGRVLWRWDKRSDIVTQLCTYLIKDLTHFYNNEGITKSLISR